MSMQLLLLHVVNGTVELFLLLLLLIIPQIISIFSIYVMERGMDGLLLLIGMRGGKVLSSLLPYVSDFGVGIDMIYLVMQPNILVLNGC